MRPNLMNADTSTQLTQNGAPIVFIVDDDEAVREALTLIVSMHGWAACPCASAREFLQTYSGQRPACLILDLAMQGMNGAELLESLKRTSNSLPAIVVTAHQDHPMAKRALKAGAIAIVPKPFRNEELTALIQSVLPHQR